MKLIITQPEIEEIVRAHVLATVQLREGSNVKIDFTATRGEDGITATIDIPYMGVSGLDLGTQPDTTTVAEPAPEKAKATRAPRKSSAEVFGANLTAKAGASEDAAPANTEAAAPVETTASEASEAAGDTAGENDASPLGEDNTAAGETPVTEKSGKSLFDN